MSRIKMGRTLLLIILAALLGVQPVLALEDIFSGDQTAEEEVNFETVVARKDAIEKKAGTSAEEYYPITYEVRFELDNAKFVEYTVSRGSEVKAGDVLMRFVIEGSDVEYTEMKMELDRMIETAEEGISVREAQIKAQKNEVASLMDALEKEKATLQLRRMETELQQYRFQQQYRIDIQQEAVDQEEINRTTTELLSPVDGVVTSVNFKQEDDAISNGETMIYLYSTEVMLLYIDNSTAKLRYNMPVTVSVGPTKNRTELSGRVVAADGAIDETDRTGKAFIQLDPYDESIKLRNPTLNGSIVKLEDVVLIPKHAISNENGKQYVNKLVDGVVQKRYIEVGASNTTDAWIITGVEEGETLIID